ncbi:MAG: MFS transporter, partial [Pseudomonadota bacterium]
MRAMLHRGWWLVTSLYLVVEAQLTPLQLVLLGTAQGIAVLLTEVPTGVVADRFSRKWSIVISHVLMGSAMFATSQATAFEAVLLTQVLWGISWTFSSGADVAWVTDEAGDTNNIARYLTIAARCELVGSAIGLAIFGLIAWQLSLALSMATAGLLMCLLGAYVAIAFNENRQRLKASQQLSLTQTLVSGVAVAKSSKTVLSVLAVTFIVNGADEVFNRLYVRHLTDLGMPSVLDSMLWLTALGMVTLGVGAVVLRAVQNNVQGEGPIRRFYVAGCVSGALGLLLFAQAPGFSVAIAGFVLVHGVAWHLVRTLGVLLVNRHAQTENRATIQSFMS